jgi:long-chain-acyl-CoA dehydrogenase
LTDIGTRRIFTQEHDMFRQTVRKFYQEEVIPHHAQWEKDGQVSREVWLKAGKLGILGIATPEDYGGPGGDSLSSIIPAEEQGYSNCSGPGFGMHGLVMGYICRYGTKEQINKYIPKQLAGEWIAALAMTEPSAGSDLQGIKTRAVHDGSDWILNGSKTFITNGYMCDVVVVVAITNPKAKSAAHGASLFLVDTGTEGFKKGRRLEKVGLKAQDTSELFFEEVRLPASALLGKENGGFYHLMEELPAERLGVAIGGIANCEFMFEETRSYVNQRKVFGKTLSDLQTIQHKLAELKTEISVGRAFVDTCLELMVTRKLNTEMASMAKYWISDLQNSVAYRCQQLHGGWGYMWEYPIAKSFVDARVQSIYAGSNEIMKEMISRNIVKS